MDLPLVRRSAVRLVVLDRHGRVLLLRIREPLHPEQGIVWELPGGGIDADETYLDAALRELREETGLTVARDAIGPPTWRRRVTFQHAGARRLQEEVVVAVRLRGPGTAVDETQQLPDELETYLGYHWWTVTEVERSHERFFPGRLPDLLRRFLSGEQIEEPFEYFS
ncbi:MAG TPA: NUDIX domain-containing protein [Nocardioidaceae bacterium]|nr:NUDIX domain-containing protein [Nocardioidaceae bacterium]